MVEPAPDPRLWMAVRANAAVVVALGLVVLLGWGLGNGPLTSLTPGSVPMKANTAVAFVASGAALLLLGDPSAKTRRAPRLVLAGGVLVLAALTLLEYMVGRGFGIDEALFRDEAGAAGAAPGRMAVLTAICFCFAGLGMLILGRGTGRRAGWSDGLALGIALLSYVSLVGYAFEPQIEAATEHITPMAFPTAVGLILVAVAILCARGPSGAIRFLGGSRITARLARPLVAAALGLPILFILALRATNGLVSYGVGLTDASLSVAASGSITFAAAAVMIRNLEHASEKQRQADARYRLLADNVEDLVVQTDATGPWIYASPSSMRLLGYRPEELLGKKTLDLIHPDDRERIAGERVRIVQSGESVPLRMRFMRRDGTHVWIESRTTPIKDEAGKVASLVTIVRDVTPQVKAEEELRASEQKYRDLSVSLEDQVTKRTAELTAANKELEAFAYSVSHDLRAPLRSLDGFSKILLEEYRSALPEQGQHYLKMVQDSANEMSQLVDALLGFSRAGRQELKRQTVDMGQLVNQVLEELKPSWGDRRMQVQVAQLPKVDGDPVLLRQVFANLLSNAIKFTRGRDPAVIQVDAKAADGQVVFSVQDNGVGFDMTYADKLFGIFQRLHRAEEFEGNGVGLAIVQRIVQRHGGRVWAESEIGKGARFFVSLPGGTPP